MHALKRWQGRVTTQKLANSNRAGKGNSRGGKAILMPDKGEFKIQSIKYNEKRYNPWKKVC